ncbi:MAG: phosphatase PAP2 family protein [Nitrospirae bacterium]|nr:phosphatase PAP2 family protein [Nitrospirota bacterium]
MDNFLQTLDFALYRDVLFAPHPDWLNTGMLYITNPRNFFLAIGVAAAFLGVRFGLKGRFLLLCAALSVAITDPLSSRVLKALFQRQRPCHLVQTPHLLDGCSNSWSFPSSHAVNIFSEATVIALIYPKAGPWAYLFAMAVGVSRVYIGVHYPFDVLGGAMIGTTVGFLIVKAAGKIPVFRGVV